MKFYINNMKINESIWMARHLDESINRLNNFYIDINFEYGITNQMNWLITRLT